MCEDNTMMAQPLAVITIQMCWSPGSSSTNILSYSEYVSMLMTGYQNRAEVIESKHQTSCRSTWAGVGGGSRGCVIIIINIYIYY